MSAVPSFVSRGMRSTVESGNLRIDVERVADAIHVSIRPASIPAGITDGPRVAMSLSPLDAHVLASLLAAHAEGASS